MGYESKIVIVEHLPHAKFDDDKKLFAEKIVEVRMSKMGGRPSCFARETDLYYYMDDGNTQVLEDKYDEPLRECEIPELYKWLLETMERDRDAATYRRCDLLKGVLESFGEVHKTDHGQWLELKPKWKYVRALHYGY